MPCRRTRALRSTFLGLGASPEFSSFASARSSPLLRPGPFEKEPCRSRASVRVYLSWGSCSRGHFLRRVPLLRHAPPLRALVGDEGCHTLVGAVLRVLAPLDGSGQARGSLEAFRPRRSPWPPTLRGLLSCRSRPWSFPPELSLPEEPYPLSQATCFLAGSRSTAAFAATEGASRPLSPVRADSSPVASPPGGGPGTTEPGRWFPAIARPVASTHECAARADSFPSDAGLKGEQPPRPLRSLAPPGSPFCDDPSLGQAEAARRCSPGNLALQSSLHHGSGFGLSRRPTQEARSLEPREPPGAQPSRLHAATRTPTPGFREPRIRRHAESIELRAPPSGDDPAHRAPRERPVRQPPAPSNALAGRRRTERLARAPSRRHPTPPCPWRPSPRRGDRRWTSKTRTSNRRPLEPLTRPGGDHAPRGAWPRPRLPGGRRPC